MEFKKFWYRSKTIVLNGGIAVITGIMALIQELQPYLENNLEFIKGINPKYYLIAIIVLGILNIINRFYTHTSIVKKDSE